MDVPARVVYISCRIDFVQRSYAAAQLLSSAWPLLYKLSNVSSRIVHVCNADRAAVRSTVENRSNSVMRPADVLRWQVSRPVQQRVAELLRPVHAELQERRQSSYARLKPISDGETKITV